MCITHLESSILLLHTVCGPEYGNDKNSGVSSVPTSDKRWGRLVTDAGVAVAALGEQEHNYARYNILLLAHFAFYCILPTASQEDPTRLFLQCKQDNNEH